MFPDSAETMYLGKRTSFFFISRVGGETKTYLPSRVISACVTIAPRGLSASFETNLPNLKSHTPTQLRVTVIANPKSRDKLNKYTK